MAARHARGVTMTPDNPQVTMTIEDFRTLLCLVMVLLQRVGGQATVELCDAQSVLADYRLGFHREDARMALALISPTRADELTMQGVEMQYLDRLEE